VLKQQEICSAPTSSAKSQTDFKILF